MDWWTVLLGYFSSEAHQEAQEERERLDREKWDQEQEEQADADDWLRELDWERELDDQNDW